jgi:hypoxanthine phosphoribosyltransferase
MGADLEDVLIGPDRLQHRIGELAAQIDADYADRELLLIGVLKGAVMVMADLARAMRLPVEMDWMAVSSYGSGTKSSGVVRILKDLDRDITGRHVLVVEDIIDSGLTLSWLVRNLQSRGPASLRVCALLRKPTAARADVDVTYVGFDIADAFVIGYGLDYAERYRNLPFIGTLAPHVYAGGGAGGQRQPAGGPAPERAAEGEPGGTEPPFDRAGPVREGRDGGNLAGALRRGTHLEMKCVHGVGDRRMPRCLSGAWFVSAAAGAVYRRVFPFITRAERKARVTTRTSGRSSGRRRDLRLVRRGRPATGAAVRRWM